MTSPRFEVRPNHMPGGSGFRVWDTEGVYLPAWYGFENAAQAEADACNANPLWPERNWPPRHVTLD